MFKSSLRKPACNPGLWRLDRDVIFLNHGSFGACPKAVLEFYQDLHLRLERQPMQFLLRDLEGMLDEARSAVARFVGAKADDLVFVTNATTGLNTVLRSLKFKRGDELLVTDQEYNASRNALNFVAEESGMRVVVAKIPFPVRSEDEIMEAVMSCVTRRTRLVMLDHVTSQTGLIFPVERMVRELSTRGIETLIDGAHAPGMVPVNLKKLGATYYTGNLHKWVCAPKSAAFLWVAKERQAAIRPLIISHGANSQRTDRSRFQLEFGWMGTTNPCSILTVPEAIRYMDGLLPGGWPEIRRRNHELVVAGRRVICEALGIEVPCPDAMIGSLGSVPIPAAGKRALFKTDLLEALAKDPLQKILLERRIEAPVIPWPAWPQRLLRISAQVYNSLPEYEKLAEVVKGKFGS